MLGIKVFASVRALATHIAQAKSRVRNCLVPVTRLFT